LAGASFFFLGAGAFFSAFFAEIFSSLLADAFSFLSMGFSAFALVSFLATFGLASLVALVWGVDFDKESGVSFFEAT